MDLVEDGLVVADDIDGLVNVIKSVHSATHVFQINSIMNKL